ncbi:uncharacterized protein LOC141714792 [Apium graveolens]|uniref:uncharacterized protein LOC141714792 n=1 Tax=Apium graveolens TaxID=4045 RepID=UPI003D78EB8F
MARMLHASALPFSLVKNPYFRKFCLRLSNSKIAGYVPPTYNRMRTLLLEQEKTHVNLLLQPFRDSWKKKGVSLCSDGWGDRHKRPLINVMVASRGNSMFVKSFDTSGNIKDAEYVAGLFLNAIDQVGPDNVVQIITDNAGNFKAAGLSIEAKYAQIFWTPCVVHSLNLALKSMCEPNVKSSHYENCKWISDLVSDCDDIVMFILNNGKALTIYQNHLQHMLVKIAETRFASHVIMAQRLLLVKSALEKTVLDPNCKSFRKLNLESKADQVKECVISDRWWDKVEYFVAFTSPIYKMIRLDDTDIPCLHLVYDMWDSMIEEVREKIFEEEGLNIKDGESEFFNDIHNILETRWNKSNTPLHCMAHSLVPRYYSEAWLKSGGGIVSRVAPNEDKEISLNRSKCFKKMFTNPEDLRKINAEYGMFSGGALGFFSVSHVIEARVHEELLSWWASCGSETPMLQALAYKLLSQLASCGSETPMLQALAYKMLSQLASSSCCERNWSSFSNIQSVKRNKLASSRTEDLVFVHNNLRLLSRKSEEYKKGPSKYWDVDGDSLNVDDDYAEAFANIFLDDPDVEETMFSEDEGEGESQTSDYSKFGLRLLVAVIHGFAFDY